MKIIKSTIAYFQSVLCYHVLLCNSMEQSSSLEPDIRPGAQDLSRLLRNPRAHYPLPNFPQHDAVPCQLNAGHNLTSYYTIRDLN